MKRDLVTFFHEKGRDLPWRVSRDPYRVYLSEIMLQQTRVEAVKGYFKRFLDRFPTVEELALSNEEEVLLLWQGLGYYSRARNLRACAIDVIERFGGEFPKTKEELLTLPGVGEYTASAIASICFGEKCAAVDGNLYRIYARLNGIPKTLADKGERGRCAAYFESWMDDANPSDINQGLMDLGELVCLPNGVPKCADCPFASSCKAHSQNKELLYPAKKVKKAKKSEPLIVFLLKYGDKYLLHKRSDSGLLASLYEFPNAITRDLDQAKTELRKAGIEMGTARHIGCSKHIFTHLIWNLDWYAADIESLPSDAYVLATKEEVASRYALPSAFAFGLKSIY